MEHLRELYQEVIVDHNRSPRNFCKLKNANCCAEGFNPLCGDQINVYLIINDGVITEVSFEGNGCAISMASASIMTEFLKGKTEQEAKAVFDKFHDALTIDDEIDFTKLGKLSVLAGVKEYPARVKCATLAWHTLKAAIDHNADVVTTE